MKTQTTPQDTLPRKRILVVDDHPVVRLGLVNFINQEDDLIVCGEADDENSGLTAARRLQPDVAVVDWSLKDRDAADMIAAFHRQHPRMPVLVLSIHDELFYAERALRVGANGYIMKQEATEKVIEAIRRVAAGDTYVTPRATAAVASGRTHPSPGGVQAAAPVDHGLPAQGVTISIVIPVYNAETTIGPLCERVMAELMPAYGLQIILVNDGSSDRSEAACTTLHRKHPHVVTCVTLSRNFGEHNAVMAGLNCAEGDYSIIMDDDFQNPPSELLRLIEEARRGYEVVYVRYAAKQHSPLRNLGSRLHNWMAIYALGKPATLYLSSFKLLSRFVVREIVRYTGPSPYIDAIVLRTTRNIGVIDTQHAPRQHGRSGYTLAKLFALWGSMMVTFSLYPLRILNVVGSLMALAGVGVGLYTVMAWAIPSFAKPDPFQTLNASNWFFRGLIFIALSVVGEYVGRIYIHLTNEPQFIVHHILRSVSRDSPRGSTPS